MMDLVYTCDGSVSTLLLLLLLLSNADPYICYAVVCILSVIRAYLNKNSLRSILLLCLLHTYVLGAQTSSSAFSSSNLASYEPSPPAMLSGGYNKYVKLYKKQARRHEKGLENIEAMQRESLLIPSVPSQELLYMQMIDDIRDTRIPIKVTKQELTATTTNADQVPPKVVAQTPFHHGKAKVKKVEKKRKNRFHYSFGEDNRNHHFYNAENDCYWRVTPQEFTSCVSLQDLTKYRKNDPTIRVAKDFSQTYDTPEEAAFGHHQNCAELFRDRNTNTYYCIPVHNKLKPLEYMYEQYYKQRMDRWRFYQYASEAVQHLPLPERYSPGKKEVEDWARLFDQYTWGEADKYIPSHIETHRLKKDHRKQWVDFLTPTKRHPQVGITNNKRKGVGQTIGNPPSAPLYTQSRRILVPFQTPHKPPG